MMPILEKLEAIKIYGNGLVTFCVALLCGFLVYVGVLAVRRLIIGRAARQTFPSGNAAYQLAEAIALATRQFFALALGFGFLAYALTLPASIGGFVKAAVTILVMIQVGLWGTAISELLVSHYILERNTGHPESASAAHIIKTILLAAIWSVLLLITLSNFGINISGLIAGLGIGGIAIAFALQSVLKDLFASLAIVLDKPFVVGDFIIFGDQLGSVERIGLKTTRVRSLWGEQIAVSNDDLLNTRVRNYKRMEERRVSFNIMVTFETPIERLERIPGFIRKTVEQTENCRFDRSHVAAFEDYGPRIETVYYVLSPDYNVYMDIQQRINFEIARYFSRNGISFAYPARRLVDIGRTEYAGNAEGAEAAGRDPEPAR
jgi:small-conductance mechanosensitive channel